MGGHAPARAPRCAARRAAARRWEARVPPRARTLVGDRDGVLFPQRHGELHDLVHYVRHAARLGRDAAVAAQRLHRHRARARGQAQQRGRRGRRVKGDRQRRERLAGARARRAAAAPAAVAPARLAAAAAGRLWVPWRRRRRLRLGGAAAQKLLDQLRQPGRRGAARLEQHAARGARRRRERGRAALVALRPSAVQRMRRRWRADARRAAVPGAISR